MKKFYRIFLLVITFCFVSSSVFSQNDTTKPVKVAIFIPLYTDDVFDGYTYTLGKANLPKSILPGLEFYNGVVMAIDSLNQEGTKAELLIYDTKQTSQTLSDIFKKPELNNLGLIIAAITNPDELKIFSDQAVSKNIPIISATYPNYVGITENPFFVLLNTSFQAHIEGLYKHIQRFYSSGTVVAITKKGTTEDYIKSYFTNLNNNKSTLPVKIKWVPVDEYKFSLTELQSSLDSTKSNVVFVASPSESFGLKIVKTISNAEIYPSTIIGMPTWDGIKELDNRSCRNVDIVFSTPFLYYSQNSRLSSVVNKRYKEKYYSRPSDMVFKGFEITYHFTKLLAKHRYNLINNLSDKDFTLFNHFTLEPVKMKKTSLKPDFLENRKLYFIKKQHGTVKSII